MSTKPVWAVASKVPKSADVVIVGGGVVGCAVAFWLAKAGVSPLLLERDQVGCEASGEAAGMLAPQSETDRPGAFFDLCLEGRQQFPALSEELKTTTGLDIEHRQIGILLPFSDIATRERLLTRAAWQREMGLGAEILDRRAAISAEPLLADDIEGAVNFPDEAHVNSRALVTALARAACHYGAVIATGCPATAVAQDGSRVVGVNTGAGRVSTPIVVLAAGPWTGMFGEHLNLAIPVSPAKGELLLVAPHGPLPSRIVYSKHAYLIPTPRGEAILGTTMERVGYDKRPTIAGMRAIASAVLELVPAIGSSSLLRATAGLRPYTPDKLPLLGPVPGLDGLILATGHHRNGILLGPITGKLIRELVLDQSPSLPLDAFRPDRVFEATSSGDQP